MGTKIIIMFENYSQFFFQQAKSCIEFARKNKVNLLTFDNDEEVYKLAELHPNAE